MSTASLALPTPTTVVGPASYYRRTRTPQQAEQQWINRHNPRWLQSQALATYSAEQQQLGGLPAPYGSLSWAIQNTPTPQECAAANMEWRRPYYKPSLGHWVEGTCSNWPGAYEGRTPPPPQATLEEPQVRLARTGLLWSLIPTPSVYANLPVEQYERRLAEQRIRERERRARYPSSSYYYRRRRRRSTTYARPLPVATSVQPQPPQAVNVNVVRF